MPNEEKGVADKDKHNSSKTNKDQDRIKEK